MPTSQSYFVRAGMQGGGGTDYVLQRSMQTGASSIMKNPNLVFMAAAAGVGILLLLAAIGAGIYFYEKYKKGRCGPRRFLVNGTCVDCTATSNSCGAGVCVGGKCAQCAVDKDCANISKEMGWPDGVEYTCRENLCTRTCTDNTDCDALVASTSRGVCDNGAGGSNVCVECASNGDCPGAQTCNEKRCNQCGDTNCPAGQVCVESNGANFCFATCTPGDGTCDAGACVNGACLPCSTTAEKGAPAPGRDTGCYEGDNKTKFWCRDTINRPLECVVCVGDEDCSKDGSGGSLACVDNLCVKPLADAPRVQLRAGGTATGAPLIAYVQPESGKVVATTWKANVHPDMAHSTTWILAKSPVDVTRGAGTEEHVYAILTRVGSHWYALGGCCGATVQHLDAWSEDSQTCGNCTYSSGQSLTELVPIQGLASVQYTWSFTSAEPFAVDAAASGEEVGTGEGWKIWHQWHADSGEQVVELGVAGDATLNYIPTADTDTHTWWVEEVES